MPRQLFPGLRRLFVPPSVTPPVEEKSAGAIGNSYVSMSYAGTTTVWGTENRAAGWDLDRVIQEGYERSVWTFKAVEAISKHPAALDIEIGRGGDSRQFAETLTDHPLLHVLNVKSNPLERASVFKKRLAAQLLLSKKGAFVEITRTRAGTITRLDLLPPDRVQPIPDPHGDYVSHFEFTTYDGRVRELDPSRVIWIRDPHPTDPFCGVTPLEAAGLSVDLDVKARTYNIAFIDNDARPSGIVGIDVDGLDQREIDRIQQRLAPGAAQAGETVVVGSGPGGLNYVDTSTRPRDMNYETLSKTAKDEILSAFGVPESIVGNASERTYANADREEWNFWSHTMLPHLSLIATSFDLDLDDGWKLRFNTSGVEALEFPRRQRRQEAREEWNAGLITVDEYREIAGRDPFDVPHTRALWISPQKAPVPANEQDAAALGVAQDPSAGAMPGAPGGQPPALAPAGGEQPGTAAADVAAARGQDQSASAAADVAAARGTAPEAAVGPGGDSAAAVVDQARANMPLTLPGDAADDVAAARTTPTSVPGPGNAAADVEAARVERKAHPADQGDGYEVTDDDFDGLSMAVAAVLTALLARQEGVILARLRAPKIRKNTRYWTPENDDDTRHVDADLDPDRVVSSARWAEETHQTLAPILHQAAMATARKVRQSLTGADAVPPATAVLAAHVISWHAGEAMTALLNDLAGHLLDVQHGSPVLSTLENAVEFFYRTEGPRLVERMAETCAVATINGAAETAAEDAGPAVVRTWITRGDDRVRPAHKALNGQTLPAGAPYTVGGASLRYPGDPFAPIDLTINCRCRLHYRTGLTALENP
ncbi:phage portal protein [Streptomyces sp. SID8379]|uniref:phage portal protein n=1 Tax=unclassified Streptomyces TaxID=2593676 RepID=UPI00037B2E31|nr:MULTISPECIES: phage portal protein [unclassified Streptomyces]MYW67156.1 phage portal protein [Streptomyces sp. SID8379]